ncbi:MAG: TSUP family transporter [Armatimonadia bacterium]|nr:TSUP family transporter [Armatimonadia bacterium]
MPPHSDSQANRPEHAGWILVLIGLAAGLVGSFFGLGGGVVFVPLITFLLRRPIHQATVTSLATMQFLALFGIASYEVQAHIHGEEIVRWDLVWLFAPAAVLGSSLVGIPLGRRLKGRTLRYVFAILLFFVAAKMVGWVEIGDPAPGEEWPVWATGPCGALVGTASGLLGVGGGFLSVPMLVLGFQVQQHHAHATSLVVVLASAVAGTLRAQHGADPEKKPDWPLALRIAPGAIIGAVCGPVLATALAGDALRMAFAGLLVIVALRMLGVGQWISGAIEARRERRT